MANIASVKVTFENRENMVGVPIIQSVISYDENDDEIANYQDIVGEEFSGDDAESEAKAYIAEKLGVDEDIIETDNEFTETPWDN